MESKELIKPQLTAVEWLYKELTNYISYDEDKAFKQHEDIIDIVNQAKAKEKQHIIEAYNKGNMGSELANIYAEKYYIKTYSK